MNVVVLVGTVTREPEVRELPSGGRVWQCDVSTVTPSGTTSVPLAWFDPGPAVRVALGHEVVVSGTVRRRFFRVGGTTQSRTEVVVEKLVRRSSARAVERLVAAALQRLGVLDPSADAPSGDRSA